MRRGQDRTGSLYRTPNSDQHSRQPRSGTSSHVLSGLGWTDIIPHTWFRRRLPGSRQHDATRAGEGDASQRDDLDLADPVGPVNNWLHSLFSQVDVYLNGTLLTPSTNTYAYRSYIETLLSYGPDAKDTQLTGQLWHKDTATRMDAAEIADGPAANEEFVTRRENILRSRLVDMIGRLHVDLFLQDKFLINGVDVKIRLVRSKPAFALMAGGANPDYKIKIVNATLFAKKATLNPTVQMARIKAHPSSARYTPFLLALGRTRTRTCSSIPCRNVWCCAASITMRTTACTTRIRFTPRTTPSASTRCTWTDDRYPPNLSSPISKTTSSSGAT